MKKKYRISRTKEKCQRFTASVRKKIKIIRRNKKTNKKNKKKKTKQNKKADRGEQKNVSFQTYILYDKAGVVNSTFVSELEQYLNIFSQYTMFCGKSDKKPKNFTKNNTIFFFS